MSSSVRLFLVGRHRLSRECLGALLEKMDRLQVVGQSGELAEAEPQLTAQGVNVLLFNHDRAGGRLRSTIRRFLLRFPGVRLLLVGAAETDEIAETLAAGAGGYLAQDASLAELQQAVEALSQGQSLCPPSVTRSLFERLAELADAEVDPAKSELFELTPREAEILELLVGRLKNREIAARLCLSPHTVKNHVHSILDKLDALDRNAAVREAFRRGWVGGRRGEEKLLWPLIPRPQAG